MRRLLPLSLCVVTMIGLSACDQEPVSGPSTDEEQALHDFRAAGLPDGIPGADANGDITIERPDDDTADGDGDDDDDLGDIILWDIIDGVVTDRDGVIVQNLAGSSIMAPETGEVVCTTTNNGLFKELRNSDDDVLYSALGVWTFDGELNLTGLNPFQAYQTLNSQLRFSFTSDEVIEGFSATGTPMARSSAPVQFASRSRKLLIAALVDGQCGSPGINY